MSYVPPTNVLSHSWGRGHYGSLPKGHGSTQSEPAGSGRIRMRCRVSCGVWELQAETAAAGEMEGHLVAVFNRFLFSSQQNASLLSSGLIFLICYKAEESGPKLPHVKCRVPGAALGSAVGSVGSEKRSLQAAPPEKSLHHQEIAGGLSVQQENTAPVTHNSFCTKGKNTQKEIIQSHNKLRTEQVKAEHHLSVRLAELS